MTDDVLSKLDELIAAIKVAAVPITDRWLDASGVGALLSQEPRYVLERLACRKDFPAPMRVGHPRWKASEIQEWAEAQRDKARKPGRKRLPA